MVLKVKSLSHVQLFVTLWAIVHQAPQSMGFSRQEYWSRLPFPSPGDLPNSGIKPRSPAYAGRCFNLWATKGTNTIREVPTSRNNHLPKASLPTAITLGLWGWLSSKEFTCKCRRCRFDPWVGKVPWRRKWQPTPIFLSGKCHVQKIPLAYSPWGCKGPDTT